MSELNYLVATLKPWHIEQYHTTISELSGRWHLITEPSQLTSELIETINPRYIFFPHWSDKVPAKIFDRYECVCFHETDVPFGRGGSPIQNLIERGYQETVITALQMTEILDAGPVYTQHPLSLLGLAEEIYLRSSEIIFTLIKEIVMSEPKPIPQTGMATVFKRRTADQSVISKDRDQLTSIFDHIRMLDAQDYPPAFIEYGNIRIEFTRPALRTGKIETTATITLKS